MDWPIIVSWEDGEGFKMLMETVKAAEIGKVGDLVVKVKCIRR